MKSTRYALLGAGMMGCEHITNINLLPNSKVVAVADPCEQSLAQARALLGDQATNYYRDNEQLLKQGGFDAVVIAAPNHVHKQALDLVFRHCTQPVLVEKPLCISDDDCRSLLAQAENYPAPIWVAMEYRYMLPIAQLVKSVHSGIVGDLRMLSIREHRFPFLSKVNDWNRFNATSGGTLVEKCCHFFDLMRLIFRAEPIRLYASGGNDVNHKKESYDGKCPDIIDNAFVVLDFPGSRRALLELCMFAEGCEHQEVLAAIGSSATMEAYVPGPQRFWPDALEHPETAPKAFTLFSRRLPKGPVKRYQQVPDDILHAGDHQGATYYQHQKFRECIINSSPPEISPRDGVRAVQIGLAAELSIRTGEPVQLQL